MDDLTALAVHWCETVARYGPGQDLQEPECLTAFLDAIGEGLRLRRQLDGLTAGQPTAVLRRKIMHCLVGLQVRAIELTSGVSPGTRAHREISARLRDWFEEASGAVRGELGGGQRRSGRARDGS